MRSFALTGTLIIGCLAGVGYLIVNSSTRELLVDQSALIEVDARLAEQRLLMIEEVLFLDAGKKRNFAQLTDMQRNLRVVFDKVMAYGGVEDEAVLQDMRASFEAEQSTIETFKRGLANSRNSQASVHRLLTLLLNSAYASSDLEVYKNVYRLEEVLQSNASSSGVADVPSLIAGIREYAQRADNTALIAAVSDVERHFEVWKSAKNEREDAVQTLVASDFSLKVEVFKKRLTEKFEGAYKKEVTQTNFAVLLCTLFLIGILFLVMRLRSELEHRRTENKRLEEAVRQRTQELEKSMHEARHHAAAKSTFLANMSHEIRTPMNGIVGMAELMTDTRLDDDQNLYVNTIKGSADALLSIINDILDYSKVESGKMSLIEEAFDLNEVIDNIVNLMSVTASSKNIEVIVDYAPSAPTFFMGDSGRLRQVLMNIVGNAVKFTLEGHVEVNVQCVKTENAGDITICIRDTGIGMPQEMLEKIFDSFVQVDNSSSRRFEGTGLGLAISKRLIDLMDGSVEVSSIEGEGSEFKINLSLPISTEIVKPVDRAFDVSALPQLRILVVDDIELNRRIIVDRFSRMGHTVTTAVNGMEALAQIQEAKGCGNPFNLALLDYQMPGMDGLELAREIRADADNHALPIVMISSVGGLKALEEYQKIDNIDCADKPIKTEHLCRVIARAIGSTSDLVSSGTVGCVKETPDRFGEGIKILIAEDIETNQLVIRKMMEPYGFDMVFARDGAEAVSEYKKSLHSIVLMDWSMPIMSGIEATVKIREYEQENSIAPTKIIGLSANAMKEHAEEGISAGMDAYLSKPIDRKTLISTLRKHCLESTDVNETLRRDFA